MKVFIAVPSMDQVAAMFCQSLAMLRRPGDTVVGFEIGSLVYAARNNLARAAIKSEADWVLWLDSDMVFNPDLLTRMLQVCEDNKLDILTAICFRRKPPYTPTIFDRLEVVNGKCSYTAFLSVPDGLFEVGGCGMAGCLMKTDVLMDVAGKFGGKLFDPESRMGEDISFCWRARQCGYKIFCDSGIEMGHVGQTVVTRSYFEAFNNGGDNDAGKSETGAQTSDDGVQC